MERSGPSPEAIAFRMSIDAVRLTSWSMGSVDSVDVVVGRMQHEPAAPSRPAPPTVDLPFEDVVRDPLLGIARYDAEPLEKVGKVDVIGTVIDDEAHGPIVRVRTHIDDRAGEPSVGHERHGDKELALEIGFATLLPLGFLRQWSCL